MPELQNRRSFLSSLATFTAASLLPWRAKAAPHRAKVLVVGGGFAGLYAADLLHHRGHDVTLLEAGPRLGGKAFGGLVGGHPYDFGCQAFSKDMPRVKALGERFGLTVTPRPKQDPFFLRGNELLTGAPLESLHKDFDVIEAQGQAQYAQVDDPKLRPLLAATSVMDWARPHLQDDTVEYWRSAFAGEWCDVPENISLLHYLEYQRGYDAEGEEMDFRFREGLFRAAEKLAEGLAGRCFVNTPVTAVNVGARGVGVTAAGRDFRADYVILAIPLTKLRELPVSGVDTSALRGSLASVQNAAVRKVLAVYDRPFWGNKAREGAINLPCGLALMDNSDVAARRWSLAIFLGGPAALENPGRELVLERVARVLGEEALRPIAYHEQAWLGDGGYLCGGYAANRAPTRAACDAMPAHLGGRVFLAGSDASREFPSYAEGALFSAEAAALGIAKAIHGML